MKKILKINEMPMFSYHSFYDVITSILEKGKQYEYDCFLEKFIQVMHNPSFNGAEGYNPRIHAIASLDQYGALFHSTIEKKHLFGLLQDMNIKEYLVDLLDNDYYIYFTCDPFYVDEYITFNKRHGLHTIFIYGYDLAENVFYAHDYFDFVVAKKAKCDIDQVVNSLIYSIEVPEFYEATHRNRNITLIKKNNYYESNIDFYFMYYALNNFVNVKNVVNSDTILGIDFFSKLGELFHIIDFQKNATSV